MKYAYDANYWPSFPALTAVLINPQEELRPAEQHALIDTGSDGTLVPIALLQDLLAPALNDAHIRSHWGEWRSVQLFLVDLEIAGSAFPGVFVVGDETGKEIVLGRNVLNKLHLALDGPAQVVEIR